jgi:hypothetical protein
MRRRWYASLDVRGTATTDVTRVTPIAPIQEKTDQGSPPAFEDPRREPEKALAEAEVKVDQMYVIPREPQSDRDASNHRGLGRRSPDGVDNLPTLTAALEE